MHIQYIFKYKSLLLRCFDHSYTVYLVPIGGSVYVHLIGLSLQDAPLLTVLSYENEHLLAVRVMYIF